MKLEKFLERKKAYPTLIVIKIWCIVQCAHFYWESIPQDRSSVSNVDLVSFIQTDFGLQHSGLTNFLACPFRYLDVLTLITSVSNHESHLKNMNIKLVAHHLRFYKILKSNNMFLIQISETTSLSRCLNLAYVFTERFNCVAGVDIGPKVKVHF